LTVDYARAQESSGGLPGARDTLQASLKANPDQFPARLLLGQIYFRSGDEAAALDQLQDAALLQPENAEAQLSLSQVLLRQKKFADVVDLLEPAANSSGDNADLLEALAKAYRGIGRVKDAQRTEARVRAMRKPKP
jgi:predicted Zn-dependent protease